MRVIVIGLGIYVVLFWVKRMYAKHWNEGITTKLDFSVAEMYPGEQAFITETITNRSWLPLPMINVKFAIDRSLRFENSIENTSVSDQCYKCDVFSMLFFQKITRTLPFTCTKRGYYQIKELDVVSTDIFMKNVVSVTCPVQKSLTVFPKILPSEQIDIPYNRIMGTILTQRYTYEDPFEFRSIREYQTYDTMRSINWKASAKTGDLKVNQYENTSCQEVCLLLNLEDEGIWEYEEVKEKSISLVCSLAYRLTQQGVGVGIISNGIDVVTEHELHIESGSDEGHRKTIVTQLSRIDLKKKKRDFVQVLEEKQNLIEKGTLLVMVSVNKKEPLQEIYARLTTDGFDSLWILPMLPGMNGNMHRYDKNKVIRWEV